MNAGRQHGEWFGNGGAAVVEQPRLSAALRLLLPDADMVENVPDTPILDRQSFEASIRFARHRYRARSWLARLRWLAAPLHSLTRTRLHETSDGDERPPLGPHSGLSADGALLLALHAGAGLPLDDLTSALGLDDEQAGRELYRARQRFAGVSHDACKAMRSALGRHADRYLRRHRQIALHQHLASCADCRTVHDAHAAADQRLARLFAERLSRPFDGGRLEPGVRWLALGPAALLTPILALVLIAVASVAGVLPGTGWAQGPAPLFARASDYEHPGWLILSLPSEVMLISLQDGQRRRLIDNPGYDSWNPAIVSPDGRRVVKWEESQHFDHLAGALRVYDLNGSIVFHHRSLERASRHFSGWLDDETVLFIERAAIGAGDSGSAGSSYLPPPVTLLAIHLPSGVERAIYHGQLLKAVASPDGTHLALVHPSRDGWPGQTIEVRPIDGERVGEPVNVLEHRALASAGMVVWSPDSTTVFTSVIADPDAQPGPIERQQLHFWGVDVGAVTVGALGIDGGQRIVEHGREQGRTAVQAVSPDGRKVAVLYDPGVADGPPRWQYGVLDLDTKTLSLSDYELASVRTWGGEVVWTPDSQRLIFQQFTPFGLGATNPGGDLESLLLMTGDLDGRAEPLVIFHDALSAGARGTHGFSLLRWVPDTAVSPPRQPDLRPPEPGTPRQVERASGTQELFGDSQVAPTNRHILMQENYPEEGTILRLMHMQAWAGTGPRIHDWGEFAWLPRESAAIGTSGIIGNPEQASRLVILATESMSPLHGRYLDPAGLGQQSHLRYRRPVVSPNGTTTVFFVQDRREGTMTLWTSSWDQPARAISEWEMPSNAQVDPQLSAKWIAHDTLIFSRPSDWRDGVPQVSTLMRATIHPNHDVEIEELIRFSAGGRDRGIALLEVALSPDEEFVAFRIRSYSGNRSGEGDVDAIRVSPASDITQQVEIVRASPGYGMVWMHDGRWLVAGVDNRIAMMDYTGRTIRYITAGPAAYPVLVGDNEIWYQDLSPRGRIMRFTLYGTATR